ncbi:oxidoreductase family protein [Nisaea nitritireducens]|uniref:oxidoreductase family protein n=1 Tax=Nisaea nitritireducens TaxID=568392 RepID=UPI0018688E8B|nr:oxidoreductase family protein [Nisaea nitritireducens]
MIDRVHAAAPTSVEQITTEWLKECLMSSGQTGAERLIGFTAEPVGTPGMTSVVHVLSLSYEGDAGGAPTKLAAKFSLDLEPVKQALSSNRGYEREFLFYKHFGADAGIPTPLCYWASYDATETRCGLLLEYLDGTCSSNRFIGTSSEIEPIIDRLAAFHARWWNKADGHAGLIPAFAPYLVDLILEKLESSLRNIKAHHRARVGDTLVELVEFWLSHAHEISELERAKPQTLCHGDLHREQILFPASPGGPLNIIDWQMAGSDSAALDLSFLLSGGLRPEDRSRNEVAFIERYYASLTDSGVDDYSMEELMGSYRVSIARQAVFSMMAFAMEDLTPVFAWWDSSPDRKNFSFWDVTCGWATMALDEHQVLNQLKQSV